MAAEHSDVPTKHKAAVFDVPGHISTKVLELKTPSPGSGDVLVKLTHSGVCHSDYGIMTNSPTYPFPCPKEQIGGHEGVGIVVQLGPDTGSSGVKVGDRVGIKWISYFCGVCQPCRDGAPTHCEKGKASGYYYPGTFQQYAITSARCLTQIPEGVDSADAAPMLCAGLTVYSALKKSRAGKGDWMVVMGAGGGLGHLACQIASNGMGMRVVGIDAVNKQDVVKKSGAEVFLSLKDDKTITEEVIKATGGGARGVLVCAAANQAYAQALGFLKHGGSLVAIGIPEVLEPIRESVPVHIIAKQLSIVGSSVGTQEEAIEVLDLVAKGIVKVHYRLELMENLTQVFEEMHSGRLAGRIVLDLQA
ncbi:alcohol dehydrogenase II [Exophiala viscosa]|uniref:Alcohol dehydrogenase II n=1 Tax=Exophiala viscosa TaxID=2486360 RepID=A0AAN6IFT0_9EURO|nr:alcohol dehydrogenase II [Exophiala viscosa]